ncbi:MAG: glycine cleavage T C-terminal barrel domain-containing protein [Tepidisphaeraceae bacterium]|jgi:folate-binding protein YgfZ
MNPLRELHVQAEAEFQPYGDVEIVCTFGEPQAEYAAIRKGCAMMDLPQRGILRATGSDRINFLNRLLSNQLAMKDGKNPLTAGRGVYSFLLNDKGRIVADVNVLERGDCTLLETDARNVARVKEMLEKHVFSEKVAFSSLIGTSHQVALHGPGAGEVLRRLGGNGDGLGPLNSTVARLDAAEAVIWRDDPCGVGGYFLIVPTELAGKLWMGILSAFGSGEPGKRQVRPAGWAVFNTARIEAGRPLFGIDFDDSVLPAETGQLDRAVSFTKGCYLGQEIVARMHARDQVARQIVGIRMQEDALPIAGAPVIDNEKNQIGGITSSTISPILSNASICLGLVKSPFAAVGTQLQIATEGAFRRGTVVEIPFVKSRPAG